MLVLMLGLICTSLLSCSAGHCCALPSPELLARRQKHQREAIWAHAETATCVDQRLQVMFLGSTNHFTLSFLQDSRMNISKRKAAEPAEATFNSAALPDTDPSPPKRIKPDADSSHEQVSL